MIKKLKFIIFSGILLLIFLGTGAFWRLFYFGSADIVVGKDVDGFIKPYAEMLVKEVNKALHGKMQDKYTFYAANFEKHGTFPEARLGDGKRILWLGSTRNYIPDLSKFDIVLASTPLLKSFLESNGEKAFYVPLFTDKLSFLPRQEEFIALIGEPPFIEDILKEEKLLYVKYKLDNEELILRDMGKFQALFIEGSALNDSSIDTHPVIFTAAFNKIPLATYWAWPDKEETVNLFNDKINFYIDKDDARRLIKLLVQSPLPHEISRRAEEARQLVKAHYLLQSARERVISALVEHRDKEIDIADNSLNFDIPVAVGHTGSGDFWLASDLASFLEPKGWHTSQTYFNSLYKYKTMVNIVVRGFLADDEDMFGNINIYYLAYPRLNDEASEAVINDKESYVMSNLDRLAKYDAVITASQSLAEAFTKRGVKTHYIPQFTNTERFYPDERDELKSSVLFVGRNAPYRKAARIALEHNLPITIYGPDWGDDAYGEYVDNRILRQYYSSAKIVLNDTRKEMLVHGVISNRVFDATAAGALVISDYMKEIEDIYGDSVPMWKTEEELVALIKYYLDPAHEAERSEKAERARRITLLNFTAQLAADKFNDIILEVKKDKQRGKK